ncbi:hypothetical protein F4553_006015 [Allocatelliglobosispora scoriae]|uniref:Uncharacterized protein n=1 Tax=Allocatelliglobosispora scoriae TaxID=643052 RepID=A0A841C122_9ACTN|nr:hypothetical protein [Allocatelliglobosispora scoriae]MBB5872581.1 hypothetical protein [Allocatelliglobosispora scoriae]
MRSTTARRRSSPSRHSCGVVASPSTVVEARSVVAHTITAAEPAKAIDVAHRAPDGPSHAAPAPVAAPTMSRKTRFSQTRGGAACSS